MLAAPVPLNEARRLATLRSLSVLDTLPEERFDRIVRLACRIFDVPLAQISLVDERRVWAKSSQGLTLPPMPRETSFCAQTILHDEPLIVTDCLEDARFADTIAAVQQTNVTLTSIAALREAAHSARVSNYLCN